MPERDQPVDVLLRLSPAQAARLSLFAAFFHTNQQTVIERALEAFFQLNDYLDASALRMAWRDLSDEALVRVWDNEDDAIYDNWRELYGVPTR
jgi:hypothetical protein